MVSAMFHQAANCNRILVQIASTYRVGGAAHAFDTGVPPRSGGVDNNPGTMGNVHGFRSRPRNPDDISLVGSLSLCFDRVIRLHSSDRIRLLENRARRRLSVFRAWKFGMQPTGRES